MNYRDEFEKIVENIKVNRNTLPEEFNQKMQPMIQFIQNNIPNQLYKFRSCTEYSLDAFEKDEIWLANASLFNDLHDSLLFLDKPTILEHAKKVFAPENAATLFKYSNFAHRFCLCTLKIQYLAGIRLSKFTLCPMPPEAVSSTKQAMCS